MSNVMLPIDPDKKDDIYYRYKMPAVQCKVEGSGNGIKTVIPNIHEVCSAINRPEEVLMKFFQFQLGAQSTIEAKDDKYLVMGKHTEERMQDTVYSFVRKFVLCGNCRNPETAANLNAKKKSEQVTMLCGACGKVTKMDTTDRAYSLMCAYYMKHPDEAKSGKGAAEARKKEHAAAEGGESPAPEAPAAAAEAAAAAEEKKPKKQAVVKSDLTDNRVNPMEVFAGHMRDAEAASAAIQDSAATASKGAASFQVTQVAMDQLIAHVVRMLSEYNMEEAYGCRLALAGIFSVHRKEPFQAIKVYAPLLRRFSTVAELFYRQEQFDEKTLSSLLKREAKIQRYLIIDCAVTLARTATPATPAAERMPVLLFLLFIEGIVKDSSILAYATTEATTATVDPAVDKEMKKNTMALVEWLQIQKEEPAAPAASAETPAATA